ncbi:MAG: hypothetical protein M0Q12_00125 [Synergistaceae bacterium]|jgi:hypothetical protein|nr:hypothetical protein [Synergistaceae bacterium]
MPSPQPGDFVNGPLTNVAVAYKQDAANFIAQRAFPEVPVKKQASTYPFFKKGAWLRSQAQVRAPGTPSAEGSFNVTYKPYECEVSAIHKKIPIDTRANYPDNVDPDAQAAEFTMDQILLLRELKWSGIAFQSGVWTTEYEGDTDFGFFDDADTDPIEVLARYIIDSSRLAGVPINKAIIPPYVMHAIRFNPKTRDYFKYTQAGSISINMLAGAIGVDWPVEILVPKAILNYAPEDVSDTETMSFVFPNHVLLMHAPASPDFMKPSAGYNFLWTGRTQGTEGVITESWWEQKVKSDYVETELANDVRIVCPDLGVFLKDAVSDAMPAPPA